MIDNTWIFDIESIVFSKVKNKAEKQLKDKYPNIVFTTTDKPVDSSTSYPTVFIQELAGAERGQDLEGKTINGIMYSSQVEVITNKSQREAKAVMAVIASIYKELCFEIASTPSFNNGSNYYRCIIRVSRIFGQGDTI